MEAFRCVALLHLLAIIYPRIIQEIEKESTPASVNHLLRAAEVSVENFSKIVLGIISIEKHWPSYTNSFEPEFPWTSCVSECDFVILNLLGQGRFGKVFRALQRSNKKQVAIKIQDKPGILKAGAEEQIKNEIQVQRLLGKNSFVAEFFKSWQTSTELFASMEYIDGFGDLFTLFTEYGHFSEQMTCLYSVEIALALEFLHNKNIIFRDLKMENISLDSSLHIKLVDFGFAKYLEQGAKTNSTFGFA